MALGLEQTSAEEVEFFSAEGLAQPDGLFEEEFGLINDHHEIAGGSSGLCNCYSGSWAPSAPRK